MSGKITAHFGADVSSVESGMQRAVRSVTGFSDAVTSEARKSADALKELLAAKDKLEGQRSQKKFNEADDLGKVKIIQSQIRDLVTQRNSAEKGTIAHIEAQMQIEKKLNSLGELRVKMRGAEAAKTKEVADNWARANIGASGASKPLAAQSSSLSKINEQISKANNLMRGGAIVAGISSVFAAFTKLSNFSRELGSSATDGQKSMAKWGDEAKSVGTAVASFLSNAVGQVLELTRSWGGLRSAQIEAGDAMVKSTGDAADAAEVRLAKAQQRAKLNETEERALKRARDASRIADAKLSEGSADPEKMAALKRDAIKADGELAALEKKAAEKKAESEKKASAEAEARRKRELGWQMDANERLRKQEDDAADQKKKDAKEFADFFAAIDEAAAKANEENIKKQADAQKEADDMRYDRAWRFATDEQKIAQVRKEGRAAQAAYDKNATSENLLALEKTRAKWLDLKDEIQGANKAANGESSNDDGSGRVRGADGKLRRGNVIVSEADAIRADTTRQKAAVLNRDAIRSRINSSDTSKENSLSFKRAEELLARIDARLAPKKL